MVVIETVSLVESSKRNGISRCINSSYSGSSISSTRSSISYTCSSFVVVESVSSVGKVVNVVVEVEVLILLIVVIVLTAVAAVIVVVAVVLL